MAGSKTKDLSVSDCFISESLDPKACTHSKIWFLATKRYKEKAATKRHKKAQKQLFMLLRFFVANNALCV